MGEGETSLLRIRFGGGKIGKMFKNNLLRHSSILSSLSPRLWPSGAAMLGKGIMSHKYLTHSTRKIVFQESL